MKKGYTMKNRGIAGHIRANLSNWKLPRVFTANNVVPLVSGAFPNADVPAVSSGLNTLKLAGVLKLEFRGAYSIIESKQQSMLLSVDAIDAALNALAQVEAVLTAHRDDARKLASVRKILE